MAQRPTINIRLSSSAEQLDLLRHAEIDVVIAYGAVRGSPEMTTRALGQEEIAALCSPEFARAHCPAGAEGFEGVVRLESTLSPVQWSDWFALNRLALPRSRTGPSFDRGSLVVAAAVQGLGVALETLRFAQTEVDTGPLIRFCGDRYRSIMREMHFLCYRTRDQNGPKIRRFCEWILRETAL